MTYGSSNRSSAAQSCAAFFIGILIYGSHAVHAAPGNAVTPNLPQTAPIRPDFNQANDRGPSLPESLNEVIQERERGFVAVEEESVSMYTMPELSRMFVAPSLIREKSNVRYDFSDPRLRQSFKGMFGIARPDGEYFPSVVRVYMADPELTVTFEELDFAAAGVTMSHSEDAVNAEINGIPATVTYRRSPGGKGLMLVSWITPTRFLKLALTGDAVGPDTRTRALALARDIHE